MPDWDELETTELLLGTTELLLEIMLGAELELGGGGGTELLELLLGAELEEGSHPL
jgi:hypothetical protein